MTETTGDAGALSLYERLGGETGLESFVSGRDQDPHRRRPEDVADTYPGAPVSDPANTNNPNHTCRNMIKSHRPFLNIGAATFDKFIGYIATSLMPLVKPTATKAGEITQAEFDALAAALNGTKGDIVGPGAPASGAFVKP